MELTGDSCVAVVAGRGPECVKLIWQYGAGWYEEARSEMFARLQNYIVWMEELK